MTNAKTTDEIITQAAKVCAREALREGAGGRFTIQYGDVEYLEDQLGREPSPEERDELQREVDRAVDAALAG